MSDTSSNDEVVGQQDAATGASPSDTSWITPDPTQPVDTTPTTAVPAETTPWFGSPTAVDPAPAYPAPAYPAPAYPAPAYPTTAYPPPPYPPVPPAMPGWVAGTGQYGDPQYGTPQYAAPQYGGGQLPGVAGWGAVPPAPKPGVVPLRPLGVGEILDGAISYIRRDPKTVLGISAVIALVLALFQFLALVATSGSLRVGSGSGSGLDAIAGSIGSITATLVQAVIGGVLGVLATGLLTVVMGQAVLGARVTASQAWARTKPRFWPLLGLTLLVSLCVGAVAALGIGLAVGLGYLLGSAVNIGLGVVVGVGVAIATAVLGTWLYVKLLLAPVALVLESAPVGRAMRRSWDLVSGAWWRTFGIYLLGQILATIVASVLAIPFSILGVISSIGSLEDGGGLPLSYTISITLATLVSSIVVIPFTAGIVALLYIDRRIRREGLDIELARAAGVGG